MFRVGNANVITWALHSNKIKRTGGLEIKHTITAVFSREKESETGLGVEAIGFHFYDTLKIILSFSAWRVGLERVEAT